jgi:hypothetical protein
MTTLDLPSGQVITLDTTTWSASAANTAFDVACFGTGTRIATPRGEVAVEDLKEGDMVLTASGGAQVVRWLGRRRVDCGRHPYPEKVWPIRVAAHAFGAGRPARTLFVSPDHALFNDGVLIPAGRLVNGKTVRQTPVARVTYWHVELKLHDLLLAESMPCESFLDTGNRTAFANCGGAITLHPDFSQRAWDAVSCAPLVLAGAHLDAARDHLCRRARMLGDNGSAVAR